MTALDDLLALVTPPELPVGAPFDWAAVEADLGTPLPEDYKAFADRYGHGSFYAGWSFNVSLPGAPGAFLTLPEHDLDHALEGSGWTAYPAPGGLLLFASTENRETFWWRTDTWTVVYENMGEFVELDATATAAILSTLRGDPPANWGESVEDDGSDDGVDRTPLFFSSGTETDGADEDDSALLEAGRVDGAWRLRVDLDGGAVDDFRSRTSWVVRRTIVAAGTDDDGAWLELKSPRWTPIVEAALNRWVRER